MPTKFIFLILPHVHILDLAGADQAIHEAIGFNADFEIEYCSIGKNIVTTSGLPFAPLKHYSTMQISNGDFLMIPGCAYSYLTSKEFQQNKELFEWIKIQYNKGIHLCGICMGTFVLAESGLLNYKFCTTHFKKTSELQKLYPKIKVQENILFTYEDNIYTSAGIAAGIDMTLHIIEKLKGSHFAHLVARELVVYNRRNGNSTQESEFLKFRNHIHSGIHKVQDFIIDNLSNKTNLADLAEIANMSERNLTRVFRKETGITVNEFVTSIRIAKATELLKNPDLSKIEVANKMGLQSEKHLLRILKTK
ncbi:MAG: DJ-1/PfpI family protein [Arcicella sp.]|jgi:transcriptional regulator GlxA family with amidase domain|nr:DJ-1/PfpI family protein [Arcicella sp.]